MSLYKGELYVHHSETDDHAIDEVETLRFAIDHLTRHLKDQVNQDEWPEAGYLRDVAETISNLCEMMRYREEQREKEPAQAVRS